jgi:hypothetical protein
MTTLVLLDWFFTALHLMVTGFNLFGWIPKMTRRVHRWCVGVTAFCWLGGGLYVGNIGYCPLTDWHWDIKAQRGELPLPNSFITYLLNKAGFYPAPDHVDLAVGVTFAAIVAITVLLALQEHRQAAR